MHVSLSATEEYYYYTTVEKVILIGHTYWLVVTTASLTCFHCQANFTTAQFIMFPLLKYITTAASFITTASVVRFHW